MPVALRQLLTMVQWKFLMKLQVQGNAELEIWCCNTCEAIALLMTGQFRFWQFNLLLPVDKSKKENVGLATCPDCTVPLILGCKIMTLSTCRAQMRRFSAGKMEYISACNIAWPHKTKGKIADSDSHYESCIRIQTIWSWVQYMFIIEKNSIAMLTYNVEQKKWLVNNLHKDVKEAVEFPCIHTEKCLFESRMQK